MAIQIHIIVKIYETIHWNWIGFIVLLNETGEKSLLIYFIIEKWLWYFDWMTCKNDGAEKVIGLMWLVCCD